MSNAEKLQTAIDRLATPFVKSEISYHLGRTMELEDGSERPYSLAEAFVRMQDFLDDGNAKDRRSVVLIEHEIGALREVSEEEAKDAVMFIKDRMAKATFIRINKKKYEHKYSHQEFEEVYGV